VLAVKPLVVVLLAAVGAVPAISAGCVVVGVCADRCVHQAVCRYVMERLINGHAIVAYFYAINYSVLRAGWVGLLRLDVRIHSFELANRWHNNTPFARVPDGLENLGASGLNSSRSESSLARYVNEFLISLERDQAATGPLALRETRASRGHVCFRM
jgi:hypothetical protein